MRLRARSAEDIGAIEVLLIDIDWRRKINRAKTVHDVQKAVNGVVALPTHIPQNADHIIRDRDHSETAFQLFIQQNSENWNILPV